MKKYVYVIVDSDKNIVAAYDKIEIAENLLPHISQKLQKTLEIKKVRVNIDLAHING